MPCRFGQVGNWRHVTPDALEFLFLACEVGANYAESFTQNHAAQTQPQDQATPYMKMRRRLSRQIRTVCFSVRATR